ncbi:MAG: hypothetical protein MZV64_65075 [Ignavibacteriales bacterium]|nr:hypothetical protein [Ignavibacteriales bacterium]
MLGIYIAGEFLNRKNPLKYIAILAMSIPATLGNPYGIGFWHYMAEAASYAKTLYMGTGAVKLVLARFISWDWDLS